jgi:diacylglycerol kinase (ATP)
VSARPTTGAGIASGLARQGIAEGADLILACGGDGTINETAEGVIGTQVPFGILPGGTANVLAHELGIGPRVERAASLLDEMTPRLISVGRIRADLAQPRHFLLMTGVGLDAHIVYRMTADLKKRWGKLAYWIAGFSQLKRRLEEFDVEVDGRLHHASFALVAKVRNYGGDLEIAREVTLLDDEFELVLFSGSSSLRYVKYLTGVAANRLKRMEGVTVLRARSVRFLRPESARVYMQIDGEYVGRLPGEVDQVPNALRLLAPDAYWARGLNRAQ